MQYFIKKLFSEGRMIYRKEYKFIPKYEYTSTNQHGDRFKIEQNERVSICKVTATDREEERLLICMSTTLDVPVRFDFHSNRAYIQLMSAEEIKKIIT